MAYPRTPALVDLLRARLDASSTKRFDAVTLRRNPRSTFCSAGIRLAFAAAATANTGVRTTGLGTSEAVLDSRPGDRSSALSCAAARTGKRKAAARIREALEAWDFMSSSSESKLGRGVSSLRIAS